LHFKALFGNRAKQTGEREPLLPSGLIAGIEYFLMEIAAFCLINKLFV
jgi:hypothetical protein